MAKKKHVEKLKQGIKAWNKWRGENPKEEINLAGADLRGADLRGADLFDADLSNAKLQEANLEKADLSEALLSEAKLQKANLRRAWLFGANLDRANLKKADLSEALLSEAKLQDANLKEATLFRADLNKADLLYANLNRADLREADLSWANLNGLDLSCARLQGADLQSARLNGTILKNANLANCKVYGVSVWDVDLEGADQSNLVVTPSDPDFEDDSPITVDKLGVAQFIYSILKNEELRDVIDTIGQKGVLILGRFTPERKAVLEAIRCELRKRDYVPIMFDFVKPKRQDFLDTVKTLAGLSRFVIADITNPRSSPLELLATMPDYMIPFVPIIQEDEEPFPMFRGLNQKYGAWVLDVLEYDTIDNLVELFDKSILAPALEMESKLLTKKTELINKRRLEDYRSI